MSSIFVDRESAYPNRYRVIPESGNAYYVILERADEPVTPGTPLNAETFNRMRDEIDADLAGRAPAGFGVGTGCVLRAQADNIRENCQFYFVPGSGNISGVGDDYAQDYWFGEHIEHALYNRAYQRITYGNGSFRGCFVTRTRLGDEWGNWEWEKPPMIPGVEYRTTKRYKGAAVYEKVDAGGNILWRADNETTWHLLASSSSVANATVE